MRRIFALLAACSLGMSLSGPAAAVPPSELSADEERELYCIVDALVDAHKLGDLGKAVVRNENRKTAEAALDAATKACRDRHAWNDKQTELAKQLAQFVGAKLSAKDDVFYTWDYFDEDDDDLQVEALPAIADDLPADIEERLVRGQIDEDMIERLREIFNEAGQPGDDDEYFAPALAWLRTAALENAVRAMWTTK